MDKVVISKKNRGLGRVARSAEVGKYKVSGVVINVSKKDT